MSELERRRARMLDAHLARRGISGATLEAFRAVRREDFVPPQLVEFAYEDTPLSIGEGQTISQPYIVAVTIAALGLRGDERVLEIGTGSGYAAAVMSRIAKEVYTVERIESLAETARRRLARLGFTNVHVVCADGTLGLKEHAPFDAIAVAAGGPQIPTALTSQLAIGGRLVMPVGPERMQQLVRVTRVSETDFQKESLGDVQFVPLIGAQGWQQQETVLPGRRASRPETVAALVREVAEPSSAQSPRKRSIDSISSIIETCARSS